MKPLPKPWDYSTAAFLDLAQQYQSRNWVQEMICLEQACYLAEEEAEKSRIMLRILELKQMHQGDVPKTAVILVTYNNLGDTVECVRSIRETLPKETYELIIVDNHSTDGTADWLQKQTDLSYVLNEENKGFPYACNQGIAMAEKNSDIFLLNNDTILPELALFWLKMGLYETERIAAAGSISNSAVNYQQVGESFSSVAEWMEYARKVNRSHPNPYEKKAWLMGFAMLIRRTLLEEMLEQEGKPWIKDGLREVLDLRFSPGNYEDNDLSIRLLDQGYSLILCRNSFIYHAGGKSFKKEKKYYDLLLENERKLTGKYGRNMVETCFVERALTDLVLQREITSVLEIGCRQGCLLARLKYEKSGLRTLGTETDVFMAHLASVLTEVVCGELTELEITDRFDAIVMQESLPSDTTAAVSMLVQAKKLLTPGGRILLSIRNSQCIRPVHRDAGSGYTLDEIVMISNQASLMIGAVQCTAILPDREEALRLDEFCHRFGPEQKMLAASEKYILEMY